MSDFISMTVAYNKGEDFHTITVDDSHNTADSVFERFAAANWEPVSVVVETAYGEEELISSHSWADENTLSQFFRDITENPWSVDALIAFCLEFGIDELDSNSAFQDAYAGTFDNRADFAENWATDVMNAEIPDWVVVDWDDTADSLTTDVTYVEYAGSTHVFYNYR